MKDLLRIADLTVDDFDYLADRAAEIKSDPHGAGTPLAGEVVGLYFSKPSTRTRFSFEVAIRRLGGTSVFVGPGELQLGRGETIEDTARTLSHFARVLVIRTFAHADVERFAAAATVPVINALTDDHHPCQALADMLALRERLQSLRGRRVAYVGDGNNVCHSLIEAAALTGLHLSIATPPEFTPSQRIVAAARLRAAGTGGRVDVTHDPVEAVRGAVAVYTDTWLSMGTAEGDRDRRTAAFAPYQVNESLLAHAEPGAIFMHCLPAHRGQEVTAEVIDGPRSIVFEQVENRGHTEQAVLLALLERRLQGSQPSESS
jgi:ornithine carbamoyltransferase